VRVLLRAARMTGDERHIAAARDILAYVERELSRPDGGFASSESSSSPESEESSELVEGIYYLWTRKEIGEVAGEEAAAVLAEVYGIEERGNLPIDSPVRSRFPDLNVLRIARSPAE